MLARTLRTRARCSLGHLGQLSVSGFLVTSVDCQMCQTKKNVPAAILLFLWHIWHGRLVRGELRSVLLHTHISACNMWCDSMVTPGFTLG